MTQRILMLGGTSFVGRAIVAEALARGHRVTTFNRGRAPEVDPREEHVTGDREDPATLAPLAVREWDLVVDPWDGAPRAALASARALDPVAGRYVYISSESVYAPLSVGVTEDAPTEPATSDAQTGSFSANNRGSELAAQEVFGARALVLRPGLILGPHENVGRLLWWLSRIAAGGEVLAPGPEGQPLQLVDARDLASFALDGADAGLSGPFNVVSRRGHATMGTLLDACVQVTGADAELTWVSPEAIAQADISAWTELPIWVPPDSRFVGLHSSDVERAHAAGLRCRPAADTVADTWAWLRTLDGPPPLSGVPAPGYPREREQAALAAWHARAR